MLFSEIDKERQQRLIEERFKEEKRKQNKERKNIFNKLKRDIMMAKIKSPIILSFPIEHEKLLKCGRERWQMHIFENFILGNKNNYINLEIILKTLYMVNKGIEYKTKEKIINKYLLELCNKGYLIKHTKNIHCRDTYKVISDWSNDFEIYYNLSNNQMKLELR